MILREVRQLRSRFDVYTVSVRGPDRSFADLSPEEQDEFKRTYYIKPRGAVASLFDVAGTLLTNPAGFVKGLFFALKLSGLRPVQALYNCAYFTQAAAVGRWMGRNRLRHLHCHYSSTVALLVQKTFGLDISISFHGPDEFSDPVGFWIREKVHASTFVRAISQYARSQLMMSSDVDDWPKIEVVYMGVDPWAFAARPFRPNPSPLEIIVVGRLAPVKAQTILIKAMELLAREGRDVRLNIVGGGPDRARLEADVAARGIGSHVVFHGFTPQEKLDELYAQSDIFALPSFAEGVPGVLMEAMAMEIPCVATCITGIPELIRDSVDGLLVPPSNAEALADAIRRLLDDPEQRLKIGQAGRARVLDRFDLTKNAQGLADIIERSLGRSSAP